MAAVCMHAQRQACTRTQDIRRKPADGWPAANEREREWVWEDILRTVTWMGDLEGGDLRNGVEG